MNGWEFCFFTIAVLVYGFYKCYRRYLEHKTLETAMEGEIIRSQERIASINAEKEIMKEQLKAVSDIVKLAESAVYAMTALLKNEATDKNSSDSL